MPERIQRKRTKGWRLPENTVSVTRPGYFGNPFQIGMWHKIGEGRPGTMSRISCWEERYAGPGYEYCGDQAKAVELYRRWVAIYPPIHIEALRGKNLACWCKPGTPCHADVLLEMANR